MVAGQQSINSQSINEDLERFLVASGALAEKEWKRCVESEQGRRKEMDDQPGGREHELVVNQQRKLGMERKERQ